MGRCFSLSFLLFLSLIIPSFKLWSTLFCYCFAFKLEACIVCVFGCLPVFWCLGKSKRRVFCNLKMKGKGIYDELISNACDLSCYWYTSTFYKTNQKQRDDESRYLQLLLNDILKTKTDGSIPFSFEYPIRRSCTQKSNSRCISVSIRIIKIKIADVQ